MDVDAKDDESSSETMEFLFHFGGDWVKKKTWIFECRDMDVVIDKVSLMSFERIVNHFSELGFPNPRGIFVFDPDKSYDDGLYLIDDEPSCQRTLEYMYLLGYPLIKLFIDHVDIPMPALIPRHNPMKVRETINTRESEMVDGDVVIDQSLNVDIVEGYIDENMDREFDEFVDGWFDGFDKEVVERFVDIPTQSSRPNLLEITYVHPSGYVSEEDEENEESDEEDEDEDDESDNAVDATLHEEIAKASRGGFTLGMTFADAKEARDAINLYGINFGYKLKFEKNEPTRLRVRCINDSNCPFKLLVSNDGNKGGLALKTAYLDHSCYRQREVPSTSQGFLADYFKNTIYNNPKFTVNDMQAEIEKHLKLHVSEHKCKRAKRVIINELNGSFKQEFAILGAYADIVKESNPGSKCELQLSEEGLQKGQRIFKRIFVMMDACKRNWMEGCRPIIHLDGCFLKGVTKGILLTAVGRDGNEGIVPIAWALVNKENKINWRWFLCWLRQELELQDGARLTLVSDMQKGFIDAVNNVLPDAEHRWCARHIYANWSKKWSGLELQKRFWICSWSTFTEEFWTNFAKLSEIKKQAGEDLLRYPLHTWVRAFQSNKCGSFCVDNNFSESFNSDILKARQKPVISMLEDIRVLAMTRIKERKKMCASWIGEWSPAAMTQFQKAKKAAIGCKVLWNGASGYEIGEGADKHTVLLRDKLCTCRVWELTRIPCPHAIAAMYHSKIDPLSQIDSWYHKSTYEKAYHFPILPVPGIKFYKVEAHAPIEPPPKEKQPGRPRKKRIRASNERRPSVTVSTCGNKLSRKGQMQCCSICKGIGHKKNACKGPASQENSQSTTSRPQEMLPRRMPNKTTKTRGWGVHVNLSTGKTTLNPGMSSEEVIIEGVRSTPYNSDPQVRGPIPNERVLKQTKGQLRNIKFNGEGSDVRQPGPLPFKPPGLQWNGSPCVTTQQLLDQRDSRKNKKGKYGVTTGSSASTN